MLSVIVPVYNAELYIDRCINSILGQTYKNFELLLIDDGSTDSSGKICEGYKYDDRVNVIHKDNKGLVSARNEGISEAKGKYICFIDADDWVDENYLQQIVLRMENYKADICIVGVKQNFPDGYEQLYYDVGNEGEYNGEEAFLEMFNRKIFSWELWGKCFKAGLLKGIKEDESIVHCEDLERSLHVIPFAKKILYTPKSFYHYYWHSSSMIHSPYSSSNTAYRVYRNVLASRYGREKNVRELLFRYVYSDFSNRIKTSMIDSIDECEYVVKHYKRKFQLLFSSEEIAASYIKSSNEVLLSDWKITKKEWTNLFTRINHIIECSSKVCGHIFIYGTGYYASLLTSLMVKQNVDWYGFLVSDDADDHNVSFRKKSIFRISEAMIDKRNDIILLAMGRKNCQSIGFKLSKEGWNNVMSIF